MGRQKKRKTETEKSKGETVKEIQPCVYVELGLIREKKVSISSTERNKKKHPCQKFAHLIVIDFESTCWERDKTKTQEIIEFPAVVLNTKTGQVEDEFHFYVQPQEHPTLSSFCHELTGISQDQVDNGIPLSLCLRKFSHWLHKLSQEKHIYLVGDKAANSAHAVVNLATIVTWSDWDLGVCLHYELRRKQISKSPCFNHWIDLRATYTKFYGRKPKGLHGALQDVGIEFKGREHSGLHDSRNTAALAWRMVQDNCIMNITKSLVPLCQQVLSYLAGSPMKAKAPTENPRISLPNSKSESSKMHCLENSAMNDKEGARSRTNLSRTGLRMRHPNILQVSEKNNANSHKRQADLTPEKCCLTKYRRLATPEKRVFGHLQSRNRISPKTHPMTSLVYQPLKTGTQCKMISEKTDSSAESTPKSHIVSTTSVQAPPQPLSACRGESTHKALENSIVKTAFRGPQVTGKSSNSYSSHRVPQNNQKCNLKLGFKTPQSLSLPSYTMKTTPPLCMCGRRAKRRLVQNPGPNSGRWFFSCTNGNTSLVSSKASGCGFFQWERVSKIVSSISITPVRKHVYLNGIRASAPAPPFTRILQAADCGQKRLSFSKNSLK